MPKLTHRFEGKVIKTYPLDKACILRIGRKPENDICLDDATVSGRHALITAKPSAYVYKNTNDVFVQDLKSTNGTIINGKKVQEEMLQHGNIIKIGAHEFVFEDEEQMRLDQTMIIDPKA